MHKKRWKLCEEHVRSKFKSCLVAHLRTRGLSSRTRRAESYKNFVTHLLQFRGVRESCSTQQALLMKHTETLWLFLKLQQHCVKIHSIFIDLKPLICADRKKNRWSSRKKKVKPGSDFASMQCYIILKLHRCRKRIKWLLLNFQDLCRLLGLMSLQTNMAYLLLKQDFLDCISSSHYLKQCDHTKAFHFSNTGLFSDWTITYIITFVHQAAKADQ